MGLLVGFILAIEQIPAISITNKNVNLTGFCIGLKGNLEKLVLESYKSLSLN
jgi:hypothetical protein